MPLIQNIILKPLEHLLRREGDLYRRVASAHGVANQALRWGGERLELKQVFGMIDSAGQRMRRRSIGFELAECLPEGVGGFYDAALVQSPTVLDAIRAEQRNIRLVCDDFHLRHYVEDDTCWVEYRVLDQPGSAQFIEYKLYLFALRLRRILPRQDVPLRIEICTDEGASLHWERTEGLTINPYAPARRLGFPLRALALRNPTWDILQHQEAARLAKRALRLRARRRGVRTILDEYFSTLEYLTDANLNSIAEFAGTSRRTLQRELASRNTSFEDVLDAKRRTLALTLLADADEALGSISGSLGYSDESAFSKAAYRWFGDSPARVRKRLCAQLS